MAPPHSAMSSMLFREFHMIGFLCILLIDMLLLAGFWLSRTSGIPGFYFLFRLFPFLRSLANGKFLNFHNEGHDQEAEPAQLAWEKAEVSMRDLCAGQKGITIGFCDIEFRPSQKSPHILRGLSGEVPRGTLLGVMGPSGVGKSTLARILSGTLCQTAGTKTLDGIEGSTFHFQQLIGFVPQFDAILNYLAVYENVLLSARIHLGGARSDAFIKQHVHCILSCMGLAHIQQQVVGDPSGNDGISGGERRRVSIARQLVLMPLALLLDEPTSGLDASTSLSIMSLLSSISRMGVTVVCVLHQPREEVFNMLDQVLLLGWQNQAFMGKVSHFKEYVQEGGHIGNDCHNSADAILDILSSGEGFALNEHCQCSQERNISESTNLNLTNHTSDLNAISRTVASRKAPWHQQCCLHVVRGMRQQSRQITIFLTEVTVAAISGLMMGLAIHNFDGNLFHGVFREPFQSLSSAVNYNLVPQLALLSTLAIGIAAAPAGVETFGAERASFYREVESGGSGSAYFVGKDLSTIPRVILSALHFTTFYMILATPAASFGMLLLLNIIYFYCVYGLSALVSSLVRRENSLLLTLLVCFIVGICDGYGPPLSRVKGWHLEWFWDLSPGTWYAEAYFTEHVSRLSYLYDTASAASWNGYVTGRIRFDIGILILMGGFYRIAAYICLRSPTIELYKSLVSSYRGALTWLRR